MKTTTVFRWSRDIRFHGFFKKMKNPKAEYLIFLIVAVILLGQIQACKKPQISLQKDLSIGVEEGDENLIFGGISSICTDAVDNVYILDWRMWRIQKFDSQGTFLNSYPIQKGQGPGELTDTGEMAVSPQGKIFLFNFMERKILVLNQEGSAVNSFRLDIDGMSIKSSGDETITVLGDKDSKLFHVYDVEGNSIRSFGEHFEVPQKLAGYDYPTVKYPQEFTISISERIYVCDPHSYEISVYRNEELERTIKGDNTAFWPVSVKNGKEVNWRNASVFESKERLYSFIASHGKTSNQIDVFEKGRQVESLDVEGYVRAIDSKGRLYAIVEEPFLQVVRYVVK